jgi:hypothetical protein
VVAVVDYHAVSKQVGPGNMGDLRKARNLEPQSVGIEIP